jgi:hypothetical protein
VKAEIKGMLRAVLVAVLKRALYFAVGSTIVGLGKLIIGRAGAVLPDVGAADL